MDPLPLLIFPGRKLKAQHTAFSPQKIAAVEELWSESSGTAALISLHLPSLEACMRTTSEYFSIQLFIILEKRTENMWSCGHTSLLSILWEGIS